MVNETRGTIPLLTHHGLIHRHVLWSSTNAGQLSRIVIWRYSWSILFLSWILNLWRVLVILKLCRPANWWWRIFGVRVYLHCHGSTTTCYHSSSLLLLVLPIWLVHVITTSTIYLWWLLLSKRLHAIHILTILPGKHSWILSWHIINRIILLLLLLLCVSLIIHILGCTHRISLRTLTIHFNS